MGSQAELLLEFPINTEEAPDPSNSNNGISFASGICVNKHGNLVVVDHGAAAVKIFDPSTGDLKHSFGAKQLVSPWAVTTTESGKIVVTDPGSGSLKVFSRSGKFLLDSEPAFHLLEPYGVAYQRNSKELVVGDKGTNCLYVHNPRGVVTDIVTKSDDNNSSLNFPSYVCYDDAGNLYVSDFANHRVSVYDAQRQFLYSYGKGDAELCNPRDVLVDRRGNLLVVDSGNCCVHLVDKHGQFVDYVVSSDDGLSDPQALALTTEGHLVVSERTTGLVKIYRYAQLFE